MKPMLSLIRIYRHQLTITASLLAIFFLFQNGSCGTGTVASGGSSTTSASVTSSSTLTITPTSTSVLPGATVQFAASGGTLPYTFSSLSGTGTFVGGLYTAPSTTGTVGIMVHDSSSPVLYNYATLTISSTATSSSLVMSPATSTVALSSSFQFSTSGGVAPYTYLHTSGSGTLSSTGYFIAPAFASTDVITVTDSLGFMGSATITSSSSASSSTSSSTNLLISSVSTNNQQYAVVGKQNVTEWPVSNLIVNTATGDESTRCYSSFTFLTTPNPATPPYIMANIYDSSLGASMPATVDHIKIRARLWTNSSFITSVYSFPTSYTISAKNTYNSGYTLLGTFTTQPDSSGVATVNFTATSTTQLVIVATNLSKDPDGNYYLQLCGLGF